MTERMKDTHSGFLVLDLAFNSVSSVYFNSIQFIPNQFEQGVAKNKIYESKKILVQLNLFPYEYINVLAACCTVT